LPILAILLAIFLLSGGNYNLLKNPIPFASWDTNVLFVHPLPDEQFLIESLFVTLLFLVSMGGFMLLLQGVRKVRTPKESYIYLSVGMSILLVAFLCLEWLSSVKF
jgi:hypothetical protein